MIRNFWRMLVAAVVIGALCGVAAFHVCAAMGTPIPDAEMATKAHEFARFCQEYAMSKEAHHAR